MVPHSRTTRKDCIQPLEVRAEELRIEASSIGIYIDAGVDLHMNVIDVEK